MELLMTSPGHSLLSKDKTQRGQKDGRDNMLPSLVLKQGSETEKMNISHIVTCVPFSLPPIVSVTPRTDSLVSEEFSRSKVTVVKNKQKPKQKPSKSQSADINPYITSSKVILQSKTSADRVQKWINDNIASEKSPEPAVSKPLRSEDSYGFPDLPKFWHKKYIASLRNQSHVSKPSTQTESPSHSNTLPTKRNAKSGSDENNSNQDNSIKQHMRNNQKASKEVVLHEQTSDKSHVGRVIPEPVIGDPSSPKQSTSYHKAKNLLTIVKPNCGDTYTERKISENTNLVEGDENNNPNEHNAHKDNSATEAYNTKENNLNNSIKNNNSNINDNSSKNNTKVSMINKNTNETKQTVESRDCSTAKCDSEKHSATENECKDSEDSSEDNEDETSSSYSDESTDESENIKSKNDKKKRLTNQRNFGKRIPLKVNKRVNSVGKRSRRGKHVHWAVRLVKIRYYQKDELSDSSEDSDSDDDE